MSVVAKRMELQDLLDSQLQEHLPLFRGISRPAFAAMALSTHNIVESPLGLA